MNLINKDSKVNNSFSNLQIFADIWITFQDAMILREERLKRSRDMIHIILFIRVI